MAKRVFGEKLGKDLIQVLQLENSRNVARSPVDTRRKKNASKPPKQKFKRCVR